MRYAASLALAIATSVGATACDYYPVPKPLKQQTAPAPTPVISQAPVGYPPPPPGYMYVPVALMPAQAVTAPVGPREIPVAAWAAQPSPYYAAAPACAACDASAATAAGYRQGNASHCGFLRHWWNAMDYCNPCGTTLGCTNLHYEAAFIFGSCRTFHGCADATPPAAAVRQAK